MKKVLLSLALFTVLFLCTGGADTSSAAPVACFLVVEINGDNIVCDSTNGTFWYPYLTDTVGMTRAGQERFVAGMNECGYGGIADWQMATSEQTQALKDSLASMGEYRIEYEWPWTPPGTPRNMGSPFLAWPVQVDRLFTPTCVMTVGPPLVPEPILDGLPMQVFNGRTTGEWWRTDVPTTPYTWEDGEADDHFVVSAFRTPGEYATMTFNYDVHYLPDDATGRDTFPGPVGTWVVSQTGPQLWPPNHKLSTIQISSTLDTDDGPYTITIDSIYQDEPVGAKGRFAPDAEAVDDSTVRIRAERDGSGNGRTYHIAFTAEDANDNQWLGTLKVGVPNNQGKRTVLVDDGPLYDSTVTAAP